MRARIIGVAITVFWVCMVSSLIVQRILPERWRTKSMLLEPDVLASQWSNINEWAWVEHNGERLGAIVLSVTQNEPEDKDGPRTYTVVQNGEAELPILLLKQRIRFGMTMELTPEFNVSKFNALAQFLPSQFLSIIVEFGGFVLDNRLFYRVMPKPGNPMYHEIPLKQPLSLLTAIRPMIARQLDLEVGRSYPVDIIDPITGSSGQAEVKVAAEEQIVHKGEKTETFRIDTTFGGITKSSWVTKDGFTIRRELLKGYYLEQGERSEIVKRFPGLRQTLEIPRFHVPEFIENAKRQKGSNPGIPPEAMNLIGQMVGGE